MKKTSIKSVPSRLALILLCSLILAFFPLGVIWSLNTLFTTLLIPYTIKTWAAVVVLSATLGAKVNS